MEKFKDVVVNNRNFRIRKFNAMVGSFMLLKVTGLLAPIFKGLDMNQFKNSPDGSVDMNSINIPAIMEQLGNVSEKDFAYIQEKCLQVVSESLPAGLSPVLQENGSFGVQGLEDDTVTVMALTVHALMFNLQSVFTGSPLASLLGGLSTTSPQN